MPLDVLSKIQNFAEGGDVKDSIGNIANSHPELKQAFQGIASAATNGGTDINPETLAKTESIMSALAKATERANMSALGLQGAFNGMSTKQLEKAEETIGGIAEKGGRIDVDIDARRAYDKIARIAKSMNGLQSNASVRIDVQQNAPRKQPSGGAFARGGVVRQQKFASGGEVQQNFAKGGKITYHRQNTETAQRGGIFRHGSSMGDRNMIFANRGEGIITEKAMRQGARQRGMSPESYIQALNHPSTNLANVKKGRSFAYGGHVTEFTNDIMMGRSPAGWSSDDTPYVTKLRKILNKIDGGFNLASYGGSSVNSVIDSIYLGRFPTTGGSGRSVYETIKDIAEDAEQTKTQNISRFSHESKTVSSSATFGSPAASHNTGRGSQENVQNINQAIGTTISGQGVDASQRQAFGESQKKMAQKLKRAYNKLTSEEKETEYGKKLEMVLKSVQDAEKRYADAKIEEQNIIIEAMKNHTGVKASTMTELSNTVEATSETFGSFNNDILKYLMSVEDTIDDIDFKKYERTINRRIEEFKTNIETSIKYGATTLETYSNKSISMPVGSGATTDREKLSRLSATAFGKARTTATGSSPVDEELKNLQQKTSDILKNAKAPEKISMIQEVFQELGIASESAFDTMLGNATRMKEFIGLYEKLEATSKEIIEAKKKQMEEEYSTLEQQISDEFASGTITKGTNRRNASDVKSLSDILGKRAHDTKDEVEKASLKDAIAGMSVSGKSKSANADLERRMNEYFNNGAFSGAGGVDIKRALEEIKAGATDINLNTAGHTASANDFLKQLGLVGKAISENQTKYQELDSTVSSLTDAWDKLADVSEESLNSQLTSIPGIGKAFQGNVVGVMANVAAVVYLGKQLHDLTEKTASFVGEQAKISKNFTLMSQSVATFSGTAQAVDSMARGLNMTREQAVALGDAMNDVAKKGIHSVNTVYEVADNLKNALGAVDTSLLKEAVALINDLPKEQVDVLIHGTGSFDDKANLIANIMNDGNLDKTIDLMMKGAFGEMEGSVQLDEKDKMVIEAQERGNVILDDIKAGIYSIVPKGFAGAAASYAKIIGIVGKSIAALYSLYKIKANTDLLAGKSGGDGIIGKLKNYSRGPGSPSTGTPSTVRGFFRHLASDTRTVGRSTLNAIRHPGATLSSMRTNFTDNFNTRGLGNSVGGALASAATAGAIVKGVSAAIAKGWKVIADKRKAKQEGEYRKDRQHNLDTYGNTVGRAGLYGNRNDASAGAENASKAAAAMGTVAASAVALGVALGTVTLGVGAVVGGLVAAGASIAAWAMGNKIKGNNAFAEQEERSAWNPMRWFGGWFGATDKHSTSMSDDARERSEYYGKALDYLDKIAKENGGKGRDEQLKEMVTLNKHVKAIEMVTKGRFTAQEEAGLATDMALIEMQRTVGGTDEQSEDTKRRAFGANMRSYAAQASGLSQQRNKILRSDLSPESKAAGLNKVIQEETKMHKKFIDNMTSLINTLGETPSIITSNLRQQLNDTFNSFNAAGFVDNSAFAKNNAESDMKATYDNLGSLLSEYGRTNQEVNKTLRQVDESIRRNEKEIRRMQSETGIQSEQEAQSNINRITEKMRESAGGTADYVAIMDTIGQAVNESNDALNGQGDMKEVADKMRKEFPNIIESMKQAIEVAREKGDKGLETELTARLKEMEKIDTSKTGEDYDKAILNAVGGGYAATSEMKKLIEETKAAMDSLSDSEKETLRQSKTFESLSRALSQSKDTKVANEKLKADAGEKYIAAMKKQSDKFLSSLQNVLNNGAIQFAKAMKDVFEQSEEYDLFGGGDAALRTMEASLDELDETMKSVKDAQELVADNDGFDKIGEAMDKYFAEADAATEEELGSLMEQNIYDVEREMYKELCDINENIVKREEKEAVKEADKELGSALRKETGNNFGSWSDSEAKALGFASKDKMQSATDAELGEAFRKFEESLVEREKKEYRERTGGELTDEQARARARDRAKDEFGDNSTWWAWREGGHEKAYDEAMSKNSAAVGAARADSERKRAEFAANKPKDMEEISREAREKHDTQANEIARKFMGTENGRKYKDLMLAEAEAQKNLMMSPGDKGAKQAYEKAKDARREFEKSEAFLNLDPDTKRVLQGMQAAVAAEQKASMNVLQADAQFKQKFMQVFNSIPKLLEKITMNSGKALALGAKQAALESKQSTIAEYGDVGKAVGMRGEVMGNAIDLLQSRMDNLNNDEYVKAVEEAGRREMEIARQEGADKEKLANMQKSLDQKVIQAKYDAEKKAKDEFVASLEKAMSSVAEAIQVKEEGLGIEKELYETIGAPFEYILDIEQELVRTAKDRAQMEEEKLAAMEKAGVTGLALEKQKNKVAKASAEVIKASFGAQRDALDKLLGKMMGGFEQIGGIFGPDSDFMKARKAGQGYTQLPSGMISASGGTVTDYADRIQSLQGVAGMRNGVKTQRGQADMFGGGRGIPGAEEGGRLGSWRKVDEGLNTDVGGMSGDYGRAITKGGNKVRMNRNEAVFSYDTLTALARPLGETPEQYVSEALSGNPYSGLTATGGLYTTMNGDTIFGKGKDRFRQYDNTSMETADEKRKRELNEKRAAAVELGMSYIGNSVVDKDLADENGDIVFTYKNGKFLKPGEDESFKKVKGKGAGGSDSVKNGDAESKMNSALQNSAFGGLAENNGTSQGGAAGVPVKSQTDKLLLLILEDTHKIAEALGVEVDWRKYEEMANEVAKNDRKEEKDDVKSEGGKDDKSIAELKKEADSIEIDKNGKKREDLTDDEVAKLADIKDSIASKKLDAIKGGVAEKGNDEKKSVAEESLDTDKEILKHVVMIYNLIARGASVGGSGAVSSSASGESREKKGSNASAQNGLEAEKEKLESLRKSGASEEEIAKQENRIREIERRNRKESRESSVALLSAKHSMNMMESSKPVEQNDDVVAAVATLIGATVAHFVTRNMEIPVGKPASAPAPVPAPAPEPPKPAPVKQEPAKSVRAHETKNHSNAKHRQSQNNFEYDLKQNPDKYGVTVKNNKYTFTTEDGVKQSVTSSQFKHGYDTNTGKFNGKNIDGNVRGGNQPVTANPNGGESVAGKPVSGKPKGAAQPKSKKNAFIGKEAQKIKQQQASKQEPPKAESPKAEPPKQQQSPKAESSKPAKSPKAPEAKPAEPPKAEASKPAGKPAEAPKTPEAKPATPPKAETPKTPETKPEPVSAKPKYRLKQTSEPSEAATRAQENQVKMLEESAAGKRTVADKVKETFGKAGDKAKNAGRSLKSGANKAKPYAPGAIETATGVYFAYQGINSMIQSGKDLKDAVENGDTAAGTQSTIGMLQGGTQTVMGLRGMAHGAGAMLNAAGKSNAGNWMTNIGNAGKYARDQSSFWKSGTGDVLGDAMVGLQIAATTMSSVADSWHDMSREEYEMMKEEKKNNSEFGKFVKSSLKTAGTTAAMGAASGLVTGGAAGMMTGATMAMSTIPPLLVVAATAAVAKHYSDKWKMEEWEERIGDENARRTSSEAMVAAGEMTKGSSVSMRDFSSISAMYRSQNEGLGRVHDRGISSSFMGGWLDVGGLYANLGGSRRDKSSMTNDMSNADANVKAAQKTSNIMETLEGNENLNKGDVNAWKDEQMMKLEEVNSQILDIESKGVNEHNRDRYRKLKEERDRLKKRSGMTREEAKEADKEDQNRKLFEEHKDTLLGQEKDVDSQIAALEKKGDLNGEDERRLRMLKERKRTINLVKNTGDFSQMKEAEEDRRKELGLIARGPRSYEERQQLLTLANNETDPNRRQMLLDVANGKKLSDDERMELANQSVELANHMNVGDTLSIATEANDLKSAWKGERSNIAGPSELAIASARAQGITSDEALKNEVNKKIKEDSREFARENAESYGGDAKRARQAYKKEAARQREVENLLGQGFEESDENVQFLKGLAEKDENGKSVSYNKMMEQKKAFYHSRNAEKQMHDKLMAEKAAEFGYDVKNLTATQREQLEKSIGMNEDYQNAKKQAEMDKSTYENSLEIYNRYSGSSSPISQEAQQQIADTLAAQRENADAWSEAFSGKNGVTGPQKVSDAVWGNMEHNAGALKNASKERERQEGITKAEDELLELHDSMRRQYMNDDVVVDDAKLGEIERMHQLDVDGIVGDEIARAKSEGREFTKEDEDRIRAEEQEKWENGGRSEQIDNVKSSMKDTNRAARDWEQELRRVAKEEKGLRDDREVELFVARGMQQKFGDGKYKRQEVSSAQVDAELMAKRYVDYQKVKNGLDEEARAAGEKAEEAQREVDKLNDEFDSGSARSRIEEEYDAETERLMNDARMSGDNEEAERILQERSAGREDSVSMAVEEEKSAILSEAEQRLEQAKRDKEEKDRAAQGLNQYATPEEMQKVVDTLMTDEEKDYVAGINGRIDEGAVEMERLQNELEQSSAFNGGAGGQDQNGDIHRSAEEIQGEIDRLKEEQQNRVDEIDSLNQYVLERGAGSVDESVAAGTEGREAEQSSQGTAPAAGGSAMPAAGGQQGQPGQQGQGAQGNASYNIPAKQAGMQGNQASAPVGATGIDRKTGNKAMDSAIQALNRLEAGTARKGNGAVSTDSSTAPADSSLSGGNGGGGGNGGMNVNVEVKITMDEKMFKAEVVKIVRENLTSIMNKPGTK